MIMKILISIIIILISFPALAGQSIVVDGDTLEIAGIKYRLHGIDTPEAGQKCSKLGGGTWKCGDAATATLVRLTAGKNIDCDDRGQDDFNRTISVCKANGVDINATMVRLGYAWAFRKFSIDYIEQENEAKSKQLGVWQAPTQTAEEFRADKWEVAKQVSPRGCPIKGNISKNGRIYHAPWSPWYKRTRISLNKGERWFCSEAEALQAGWRAPYWGN